MLNFSKSVSVEDTNYILDGLRVCKSSANFHFWVNYSFNSNCHKLLFLLWICLGFFWVLLALIILYFYCISFLCTEIKSRQFITCDCNVPPLRFHIIKCTFLQFPNKRELLLVKCDYAYFFMLIKLCIILHIHNLKSMIKKCYPAKWLLWKWILNIVNIVLVNIQFEKPALLHCKTNFLHQHFVLCSSNSILKTRYILLSNTACIKDSSTVKCVRSVLQEQTIYQKIK